MGSPAARETASRDGAEGARRRPMRLRTISFLAMAAIVGAAAAVGWAARTGGDPAGEPISLAFSDVTVVDGDMGRGWRACWAASASA